MKLTLLLIAILSLCSCRGNEQETGVSSISAQISEPIKTKILNSEPIKIELEKLPLPYASNSVSKPPRILPIPSPRIFYLPKGFQVNVYAEGLKNPRWLALTPEGHVLVTETRDNRITLLQDSNKDGVADKRSIFANQSNGLNIPFGMAFTADYFFLGNRL